MLVALSMSIRTSYSRPIPTASTPSTPCGSVIYIYIYIYILLPFTIQSPPLPAPRCVMGGGGNEKRKKLTCEADGCCDIVAVKKSSSMWAGKMRQKRLKT